MALDAATIALLQAKRTELVLKLTTISVGPSYSIEGQSVQKGDQVAAIQAAIAAIDSELAAHDGPWEIESIGG